MVTVAVLAILVAIAVPNLQAFIVRNALTSATSELRSVIARARVEAITRNTPVSVTPTSVTGSSPARWSGEYRLFVNPLGSPTFDSTEKVGNGTDKRQAELLMRGDFQSTNTVKITGVGGFANVTYGSDGRATNANGTIKLCVDNAIVPTDNVRTLLIAVDGRVTIDKETLSTCP